MFWYGLYYLRSMGELPVFLDGNHGMRHQPGLWNGIWSDNVYFVNVNEIWTQSRRHHWYHPKAINTEEMGAWPSHMQSADERRGIHEKMMGILT